MRAFVPLWEWRSAISVLSATPTTSTSVASEPSEWT